ncbi:DNA/RNA non-specific endonuclease [Belnapia rosea]|uniref:DNA/RNA non-specific endonuclease n=1 Tax=Belnapia rosea TaxID=938405 RepID=UPI00087F4599|nr:DNA/RNA non-specific endonuclease [Belnapia rosea]SDB74107.1 endonuclease G [Belnapia rosea]
MSCFRSLLLSAALLACAIPGVAQAAASTCPQHYAGGVAADILRPALAAETRELCFEEYGLLYSGISRTPLAVAEYLTRARIEEAQDLRREGAFHEEERLPPGQRARLGDYARSGFDRGHMAPAGDMATPEGQAESFSLANMVPQDPGSNRCLWERIESAVRDLTLAEGEVWVLTGPIFQGEELERLNRRVLVPTSLYKAVYLPSRREAAAYIAPNAPGTAWRAVSLAELRDLAGLDAFPTLAPDVQAHAMRLPKPRPHNPRSGCGEAGTAVTADHRSAAPRSPSPGPVTPPATRSAGSGRGGNIVLIVAALVAGIVCYLLYRVLGHR